MHASDARAEDHEAEAESGTMTDAAGQKRFFAPVYDAWFGPDRRRSHPERAILEGAGALTAGLLYYWSDPLANSEDWDDPNVTERFDLRRGLAFDTNLNTTNHFLHPGAGAIIYGTSRVNGISIAPAIATAAGASLLWEFALEWREKPSINDLVYTSIGGTSLGEFALHLGDYVNSAPNGGRVHNKVAAWIFGGTRRAHMALDHDEEPAVPLPPDALGFSSAYGHQFLVSYSAAAIANEAGDEGALHRARIRAEIVDMPGFLAPGRFAKTFTTGNFTDLDLRFGWGGTGLEEVDMQTRATFAGRYTQRIDEDRGGHGTLIGVGSALRFNAMRLLGRHDQLSMVHLIGPHAAIWATTGAVTFHLRAEAYPDFASIASLAYRPFVSDFEDDGLKSVLRRQGYQYHLGLSTRVRAALQMGPISVTGSAGRGTYESIEGRDRFQRDVTRDLHGTEDLLELEGDLAVKVVGPLTIGAGAAERHRRSRLGETVVRRRDRDVHLTVGIDF